jgi:class 3 adenylate cyclase/energy-coupling factor transporter ATP-binding protein EcfA2
VRANARFCDGCGARLAPEGGHAEYKQVTVLFADVVHSMDLAAAVGAERLREIMAELFDRSSAVVQRFGGTVDKFTGDGVMAVFGAPIALEDHAVRACLASLEIQEEIGRLGKDVELSDGVAFELRVGLNSGEVIAGEIGSGSANYTTVGEQVGLAQRMESVAPPGGVMISESTARLVEASAALGDPEDVHIKGASQPMVARRLLAAATEGGRGARELSTLVGRDWEVNTIGAMLDQSMNRKGRIVGLVGPPGIGKSRMAAEIASLATDRSFQVFTTTCESHTSGIPFHAAAGLLRDIFAIDGLADEAARANVRARMEAADSEDVVLLEDLLGIRDGDNPLPAIDPDARGRRLTALLNAAAVARTTPAVYVIEDVHWIDEVSEAMIAQFATVLPQTPSLMIVTYRPEYRGVLDTLPSSHRIALAALDDSESTALAAELLGSDDSVVPLLAQVAERAAGNPFFAEELVRDLAERGILTGARGNYVCRGDAADVGVPASLQATIASRIDRLRPNAKRTLNAAAVIGSQFDADLLSCLVEDIELAELKAAELIDQVAFGTNGEYAFRHPLIRTVAYESQLKSDRTHLHRRLAAAIEGRDPEAVDSNAALVAQHLEAAGDLSDAFDWHMRAASWAQFRDVAAARTSWQRARDVADRCPVEDPNKVAMQIRPRTALCASAFRFSGRIEEVGYDELRQLCISADDKLSLAFGMAGMLTLLVFCNRFRDAARVASECSRLVDSMSDPAMTLTLSLAAGNAKFQAGEVAESLRLAQRAIDLADGDPTMDNFIVGSPLAFAFGLRGSNRFTMAIPGWRDDFDRATTMSKSIDLTSHIATILLKHAIPIQNGASVTDETAMEETAEALELAKRGGDDFAFDSARLARGVVLVNSGDVAHRPTGLALMNEYRDAYIRHGYATNAVRGVDIVNAREKARVGDLDGAIETARVAVDFHYESGDMTTRGPAVAALVELLIRRGGERDLAEVNAAIERLAAVPTDPGFVLHELPLLRMRALLAQAHGDGAAYEEFRDRYRNMANDLGFEGHMAIGAAMD